MNELPAKIPARILRNPCPNNKCRGHVCSCIPSKGRKDEIKAARNGKK